MLADPAVRRRAIQGGSLGSPLIFESLSELGSGEVRSSLHSLCVNKSTSSPMQRREI